MNFTKYFELFRVVQSIESNKSLHQIQKWVNLKKSRVESKFWAILLILKSVGVGVAYVCYVDVIHLSSSF